MASPAIKMLLGGGGAAGPQLPGAIMALTPLGYWKLDDSSGTTAVDSSGNGANGTYGGSGYTLQGATGGDGLLYADFGNGGNSSQVTVADSNAWSIVNGSGPTIFALIKPDSVAGTTQWQLITKGKASNYEWFSSVNNGVGGRFQFQVNTAAGSAIQNGTMTGDPITTNWQAIAIRCVNPVTNGAFGLYRNSNTDLYSSISASGSGYLNNSAQLMFGYREDTPANQYFQGGIAHVAIFPAELDSTQLASLFTAADNDGWY